MIYMLPIVVALVLGVLARAASLPPLVGFLIAGFVLNAFGIEAGEFIHNIADVGVYLLLFGIGLKLKPKTLARPEIWATASIHMALTILVFGIGIRAMAATGFGPFAGLDFTTALMVAFALSFSSTVFAVKTFEERGDGAAVHARVAIGILIVQDIFAILFLTASTGKIPSHWAALLLLLPVARPLLMRIMTRCGHGELLVLLGVLLTLGAAELFSGLGMKPDLGPLIFGVLVGGHPKSEELSKTLLGFKDLFLTGFFLTVGLAGMPGTEAVLIAVAFTLLVPFKVAMFFALLTRFRLRSRSALMTSFSLANYSEFGLIVGAVGASAGWISGEWLTVVAVALSLTFILAAPLNIAASSLYHRFDDFLLRWQRPKRLPYDQPIESGAARIAVFGMGRIGSSTYDVLCKRHGDVVLGVDADAGTVERHLAEGRNVVRGDASDSDFWENIEKKGGLEIAVLAMADHGANLYALEQLADIRFEGVVAATARFADEREELIAAGADFSSDVLEEAGRGFAEHLGTEFEDRLSSTVVDA